MLRFQVAWISLLVYRVEFGWTRTYFTDGVWTVHYGDRRGAWALVTIVYFCLYNTVEVKFEAMRT